MNNNFRRVLTAIVAATLVLSSCKKDDDDEVLVWENTGGTFVVNEGAFQSNNGSISYINSDNELTESIFEKVNGYVLGDVVQSMTLTDDKAIIVVNGSQKVEIVSLSTFELASTLTLDYPRYAYDLGDDKAFVSNGSGAGEVKLVDLNSGTVTKSITVGNGPEKMVEIDDYVYVMNTGGYGLDSTISVIDLSSNTVSKTITVGHKPKSAVIDADGDLWVVCSGNTVYDDSWNVVSESNSGLYEIDPSTNTVLTSFDLGVTGDHVSALQISPDGKTLYFDNGGVRSISTSATSDNSVSVVEGSFYGFNVNPTTGNIFTSTFDFVSASTVSEYSAIGDLKQSWVAGIGTNSIVFQ